ncbi:MAG TPA: DUF6603 domain-containing protein [Herpetosiphonaceae bacterium]
MNGSDIKNKIDPYAPGGHLTLDTTNTLGSPGINTLLGSFFGGKLVATLGDPQIGTSNVVYPSAALATQGFALYGKQTTIPATITFYADSSSVIQCTVQANIPDPYGFGDSFPVVAGLTSNPINSLGLSKPVYTLDSTFAASTTRFQSSILTNAGLLQMLAAILGQNLTISGDVPITEVSGSFYPEFNVQSSAIKSPSISGFELDLFFNVRSKLFQDQTQGGAARLLTSIDITTELITPALTLPIVISMTDSNQTILPVRLDLTKPAPSISSLDQISGLTKSGSPASQISADTPIGTLSLDSLSFVLDTQSRQITDLQIGIHLGTNWTIVDNILALNGLTAVFQIPSPLNPDPKQISATVTAQLQVVTAAIDAYIQYPDKVVGAQLAYGSVIDINDFIQTFARGVTLPGNSDLQIYELDLFANIDQKSYGLSCQAIGTLTVIPNFVIEQLSFSVEYSGGSVSLAFGCLFAIADAQLYLAVSETDAVWTFSGGTYQQQNINLSDLVADLLKIFGVQLPGDLPKIILSKLELQQYETKYSSFSFQAAIGYFNEDDPILKKITGACTIARDQQGAWSGSVTGTIEIGQNLFTVEYDFKSSQQLTLSWQATGTETFGIASLCDLIGAKPPDIPPGLDLGLKRASISYNLTSKQLTLAATSVNYGQAVFVMTTVQQKTVYVFGVDVPLHVTLADIPLVGGELPDADQLGINDIGFWLLSDTLLKAGVEQVNTAINAIPGGGYPTLPDRDLTSTITLQGSLLLGKDSVALDLTIGGSTQPVSGGGGTNVLATSASTSTTALATTGAAAAAPPADNTKWFNVQKTFGIFSFKRIGILYQDDGTLFIVLDSAIVLGPLTFSMDGLALGSPLTHFSPAFHLSGLGLAYNQPPLEIMGAFFAVPAKQLAPDTAYQYDGLAVIKASQFSFSAIGSYAQLASSGEPSLFVFAQVEGAFGGPPAFFITGIMAGFGYNRALQIPAQDEVFGFPLLVLAQPPAPGQPIAEQDPSHVLDILEGRQPIKQGGTPKAWIAPQHGEYWLALGIEFTSFKLVNSKALLIAQFGTEFALTLLGLATMRLPQGASDALTYAYVELQLEATLKPQEGIFGLTAVLSPNSYVIAPACHLTGGFAFFIWFGPNPNAGQFVITLGGYHPAFSPPSYFPQEPRLGFNWAVSDLVTIKGEAYFALTTSCVMAGGGLQVLFHSGNLRAWFTAQADLLISWRPFFFMASIEVSIGVSYKLDLGFVSKTLSLSLGASVKLWGPPTGGTVRVHLWVVSFTVAFGSDNAGQANTPLPWPEFQNLLPPQNDVCKITAGNGLQKSIDDTTQPGAKVWVVRATSFSFATESAIPASQVTYGSAGTNAAASQNVDTGFTLNIRPMNTQSAPSTHAITIQNRDDGSYVDVSTWSPTIAKRNMPESLWGAPLKDAKGNFTQLPPQATANTIASAPVGSVIQLPPPQLGPTTGLVTLSELAYEPVSAIDGQAPLNTTMPLSPDYLPTFNDTTVGAIEQIMSGTAQQNRTSIFNALTTAKLYSGPSGDLSQMAQQAQQLFSDSPLQVSSG